jgi:hypothetical protein
MWELSGWMQECQWIEVQRITPIDNRQSSKDELAIVRIDQGMHTDSSEAQ